MEKLEPRQYFFPEGKSNRSEKSSETNRAGNPVCQWGMILRQVLQHFQAPVFWFVWVPSTCLEGDQFKRSFFQRVLQQKRKTGEIEPDFWSAEKEPSPCPVSRSQPMVDKKGWQDRMGTVHYSLTPREKGLIRNLSKDLSIPHSCATENKAHRSDWTQSGGRLLQEEWKEATANFRRVVSKL